MTDDCTPVLLSLTLIADVLGKPVQSVHRWRTAAVKSWDDGGAGLPPADVMVGSTPLWFESTFLEYADRRKLTVDWDKLDSIRESQVSV